MDISLTAAELEALRWYIDRTNNGRGRLTGIDARLLKRGLLRQRWVSMNCWVVTLSERGKAVLRGQALSI